MSVTILRRPQRAELEQSLDLLDAVEDARAREAAERIRAALGEADQEEYLTTMEAARALGVRSVNTIKLWVKTGYLQGRRIGGRLLIPRAEIERLEGDEQVQVMRARPLPAEEESRSVDLLRRAEPAGTGLYFRRRAAAVAQGPRGHRVERGSR